MSCRSLSNLQATENAVVIVVAMQQWFYTISSNGGWACIPKQCRKKIESITISGWTMHISIGQGDEGGKATHTHWNLVQCLQHSKMDISSMRWIFLGVMKHLSSKLLSPSIYFNTFIKSNLRNTTFNVSALTKTAKSYSKIIYFQEENYLALNVLQQQCLLFHF